MEHRDVNAEIAAARREGMIEGLERAVDLVTNSKDALAIRAEIERLKGEA